MKKFLLLLAVAIGFASCSDDDKTADIDVNYKLLYGGEPLVMLQDYTYPTGETMQFNRFSFYLNDLSLKYKDEVKELMDIDYLNFTDKNINKEGAEQGISFSYKDVDLEDLESLNFFIGVDAENNAKTPVDFPSSNVLSKTGEYWGGWKSYVFSKTEGYININDEEVGFSLHIGGDEAYMGVEIPLANISEDTKEVNVLIDLKDYFGKDNVYNIEENPQLHSLDHKPQVLELVENMKSSIYFNLK